MKLETHQAGLVLDDDIGYGGDWLGLFGYLNLRGYVVNRDYMIAE
jgi:hypothetical protein